MRLLLPTRPHPYLAVAFFLGLATLAPISSSTEGTSPVVPAPSPEAFKPTIDSRAAEAARRLDCEEAARYLGAGDAHREPTSQVLLGLYSHQCGRHAESLAAFASTDGYAGDLADWRLWVKGESAFALGHLEPAQRALENLIEAFPQSPLHGMAVLRAAEVAFERKDYGSALDLATRGQGAKLDNEERERLYTLTWRLGQATGDEASRRAAARELLIRYPLTASELNAAEIFRREDGKIPWAAFLTKPEIEARARSLAGAKLYPSALSTLQALPGPDRDLDWAVLVAEILISDYRGKEALNFLEGVFFTSPEERQRLEWWRARSALEASKARRGRTTPRQERERFRLRARAHLEQVAALGQDDTLAIRALRILFDDLAEEERFAESLDVLKAIQKIDPTDTTGAWPLWRIGWREYSRQNYSGAIGNWAELAALYPETNASRSAHYWSARAHGQLGNHQRERWLFEQVIAAGVDDFYGRHARKHLGAPQPVIETPEPTLERWPQDLRLERVRLLTDLGLDEFALIELERRADEAERRATNALRARILARQEKRRESIIALRRVFPDLGTPRQNRVPASAQRLYYPLAYSEIVESNADRNGLPAELVYAMIRQESAFDATARSWAGAQGLMQLMPATGRELARRLGLPYSRSRLNDPAYSVRLGTAYYRQVKTMFGDDDVLALAGYNAGPYRIKRLWAKAGANPELDRFVEDLPMSETRTYVKRVTLFADSYRRLYG